MREGRALDREILALAVPALGTLAIDPVVSMVDTAWVGRLGAVPLAALGICSAVFGFVFVLFNFLAYGTTPAVARALGAGHRRRAGEIAVEALSLALALGTAAALVLELAAEPVVRAMGGTGEVAAAALAYLRVRALAGPAVLLATAAHGVFRGMADTRTPLGVSVGVNALNLVLDPLLIFGLGWGVVGAATATTAAQWVGAAWFLRLLARRRHALGLEPRWPHPREWRPLLAVGSALTVRTLALLGVMTLAAAVAARVGTAAVAAHQVVVQVWFFLALVVDALAVAGQALVAERRGAGDPEGARRAADRLLLWGAAAGGLLALVLLALRPWLPRLFTADPSVLAAVASVYPFLVALEPVAGLVFVWDGIFIGAEDFRYLAAAMVASAAGAAAVLLLVLPMGWGLPGVWWGIAALMGLRTVTLGWRHLRGPLARGG